ncbi:hypothetical protein MBLNU459_g3319t1 [Dothideomycetes sp. NU459]
MRFITLAAAVAPILSIARAQGAPGYTPVAPTINETTKFSFGSKYAVLNLDLINGIVGAVVNTTEGDAWISSVAGWIDAVHAHKASHPLQIFTRIYFQPGHPEVGPTSPFRIPAAPLLNDTETVGAASQLYPAFKANPLGYANGTSRDVVLQKTRYDATYANQMVEILIAQKIDTVIISGIRTSGVVLSTAYTLFDLDFNVYVISNNSIETPSNAPGIDGAIKAGILPKLPVNVITIDQAKAALALSG